MAYIPDEPVVPPPQIITLLTDFGTADIFVGSMKGVILGINPQAEIVDLSHEVPPHNIRAGAFLLHSAIRYFPPGTIHVAVVDPGVGSERRPLLVFAAEQYFIAPDNGILSSVLDVDPDSEIRELTAKQFFLGSIGSTFHGRDVFAPVAAWLSRGEPIESFGPVIQDIVRFEVRRPVQEEGKLVGEVQHIDRFGNLITNITEENVRELAGLGFGQTVHVRIGNSEVKGLHRFYADTSPDFLSALINSNGWLELFCNQGRADNLTKAKSGDRVEVWVPK